MGPNDIDSTVFMNRRTKTMNLRRIGIAALLLSFWALSAMTLGIGSAQAQDSTPASDESFPVNIRFLNAMTSLDKVDVYINGDESDQRVVEGLEYGTTSDAFTGTAPVTGVVVKQNVNAGFDRYIYSTVVPTEAGKEYLVVITDLVLIPTEFDQSRTGAGMARARVINAAPQSPALDIYASEAGAGVALGDLIPVITGIGYGGVTDGGELARGIVRHRWPPKPERPMWQSRAPVSLSKPVRCTRWSSSERRARPSSR